MNIHEALIIGGSSGIGKAVASRLLYRGLAVTLVARDVEKLDHAVKELSTRGPVNRRSVDLYNPSAVASLRDAIRAQDGPVQKTWSMARARFCRPPSWIIRPLTTTSTSHSTAVSSF